MTNADTPSGEGPYHDRPLSSLPNTLTLRYSPGGEQRAARAMEGWVKALVDEAEGQLVFEEHEVDDEPFLPRLSVSTRAASSVHYHFVPEGPEVAVFREFLWETASQADSESTDSPEPAHPGPPREMLLFVSTHCPNCPRAVRTVQALTRRLPNLAAHLFEAMLHTELAAKHTIQSVPTLLIDQELRYVGGLEEEKLYSLLSAGDPDSFLHEKIRKQIKEGGSALEAAEWIAGGGDPSFLAKDLGASTFEERIALLLALEEALETDPRCLDRMVAPLLPHLEAENASVRGDIADLLGKIGDRKALPAVRKLLEDPDPNVVEAAQEAVETLEEGS
jgi:glutaredoxin